MRTIPLEKADALINGFYDGLTNRELAMSIGVALKTVASHRRWHEGFWRENPEYAALRKATCDCGRPVQHRGRCKARRLRRIKEVDPNYTPYRVEETR